MKNTTNAIVKVSRRALCIVLMLCIMASALPLGVLAEYEDMSAATITGIPIAPLNTDIPPGAIRINNHSILDPNIWAQAGHYVLEEDIDLKSDWVPVDNFRGQVLDGRGYTINSLVVPSGHNRQHAGLFGRISNVSGTMTIRNLGINIGSGGVNANNDTSNYPYAPAYAGGIVGLFDGGGQLIVENCFVSGRVSANAQPNLGNAEVFAGGLVGRVENGLIMIRNSFAAGSVSSTSWSNRSGWGLTYNKSNAGGLLGSRTNGATFENCYSSNTVRAESSDGAGSFLTYDNESRAGGLIGDGTATVTASYRLSDSGTVTRSGNNGEINNAGTPISSAQLRQRSSFAWSDEMFNSTWGLSSSINNGFPVLRIFFRPTGVNITSNISPNNNGEIRIPLGEPNLTLSAAVLPELTLQRDVTWASSEESVVTVNNGVITTHSVGTAVVKATTVAGGYEASLTIIVYMPVTGVEIIDNITITIGGSQTLIPTIYPDNATYKNVEWSSNNEDVATVDINGRVTAHSVGTARITVRTEDGSHEDYCEVTVTPALLTGLTLPPALTIIKGETDSLTAAVVPPNTGTIYKDVTWSSSNDSIVSVTGSGDNNLTGILTALSGGTVTITVTSDYDSNIYAACEVTVIASATGVTLDLKTLYLPEGKSDYLTATVQPVDATDKTVTWHSSDESVVTVAADASDSLKGLLSAVSVGEATITVKTTDGDFEDYCVVTVFDPSGSGPATGVVLNKTTVTIQEGHTDAIRATVTPPNAANRAVTWVSSNPGVATVDSNGIVRAISAGTAVITATTVDGGFSAICNVTVKPTPPRVEILSQGRFFTDSAASVPLSWNVTGTGTFTQIVTISKNNQPLVSYSQNGNSVSVILSPVNGLKDIYTVRVTATNQYGDSGTDTTTFEVYNRNALSLEYSPIDIDNHGTIEGKSSEEIWALRSDLTLSRDLQLDTSNFQWTASDGLMFQMGNENIADVFYLSNNGWIKASPETAIHPLTPMRVVGYENGTTTLTVTHKNTGIQAQIPVRVNKLDNKLFFIRVTPAQTAHIMYDGLTTPLVTNSRGEIAIYSPNGNIGDVTIESVVGSDRWIGSITQAELMSGEQTNGFYPVNHLRLTLLSNITLFAVNPPEVGGRYQGNVQISGGLYRNDVYIQSSEIMNRTVPVDTSGRVFIQLNTASFGQIGPHDVYKYIFEVRFLNGNYAPMIIEIDATYDHRDALRSNMFTTYLREWGDRSKPTASYFYNGTDVTAIGINSNIGVSDDQPTGVLVAYAALPLGWAWDSARVVSAIDGAEAKGHSAKVIDLPFLTDISYAEVRWEMDSDTITPLGVSRSFNIVFRNENGSEAAVPLPFGVVNAIGLRSVAENNAGLTIPLSNPAEPITSLIDVFIENFGTNEMKIILESGMFSMFWSLGDIEYSTIIEPTNDPFVYRWFGYSSNDSKLSEYPNRLDFDRVKGRVIVKYIERFNPTLSLPSGSMMDRYGTLGAILGIAMEDKNPLVNIPIPYVYGNMWYSMYEESYIEGLLVFENDDFILRVTDGDMYALFDGELTVGVDINIPVPPLVDKIAFPVEITNRIVIDNTLDATSDGNSSIVELRHNLEVSGSANVGAGLTFGIVGVGLGYGTMSDSLYSTITLYDVINDEVDTAGKIEGKLAHGLFIWRDILWDRQWHRLLDFDLLLANRTLAQWGDQNLFLSSHAAQIYLNTLDMSAHSDSFIMPLSAQNVSFSAIPDNPLGAIVAGDESFAVAAWETLGSNVDQVFGGNIDFDNADFIDLFNQTEISVSVYNGSTWSAPMSLTDNGHPDFTPVVAVHNGRAVVVWQSPILQESSDGVFGISSAELWYSVLSGTRWSEPIRLDNYNYSSLLSYQVAMNNAGFAVISSSNDVAAYFVSHSGVATKTVLSNADATTVNPQIVAAHNGFYLSWYSFLESGNDIFVKKMLDDGTICIQPSLSVAEVTGMSRFSPAMSYHLANGNGSGAAILCKQYDFDGQGDMIFALKLSDEGGIMTLGAPVMLVEPKSGHWFEITGGELIGNTVTAEYAEGLVSQIANSNTSGIVRKESYTFSNAFVGGAAFNDLDVIINNDLQVTFGIINTGIAAIDSFEIKIDGVVRAAEDKLIMPGAAAVVTASLPLGSTLSDASYNISVTFTNGDVDSLDGVLTILKPDVSIGRITTLTAENGERDFSVHLFNDSDVPLRGGGYEVRLSFFEDSMRTIPASVYGQKSIVLNEDLGLLDDGGLNLQYRYSIPTKSLVGGEIPESGVWLYIQAEIWKGNTFVEQRSYLANRASLGLNSLIRSGEPNIVIAVDTAVVESAVTADLHISNRSMQPLSANAGMIRASLYDADGNVVEVQTTALESHIAAESNATQTIQFSKSGAYVLAVFEPPSNANDQTGSNNNQYNDGGSGDDWTQSPSTTPETPATIQEPETSNPASTAPIANPFIDINVGDWYYEYVMSMYAKGLMIGTGANIFSPNSPLTRGMLVTILYRHAGEPDVSGLANEFSDVAGNTWYSDAVIWAAENGIVTGYGGGLFGPMDNITRQDLAVILARYAVYAGATLPVNRDYSGFNDDASISDYAKEAVERLFKAAIIEGRPGEIFDPLGQATRAEVAAMVHRFLLAIS